MPFLVPIHMMMGTVPTSQTKGSKNKTGSRRIQHTSVRSSVMVLPLPISRVIHTITFAPGTFQLSSIHDALSAACFGPAFKAKNKSKLLYSVYSCPILIPTLSQLNPAYTLTPIHFVHFSTLLLNLLSQLPAPRTQKHDGISHNELTF
jgi:hypothetical protein